MLGRFELLFGIIGAWIASIIFLIFFKKIHRDHLPKGSIIVEGSKKIKISEPPGTRWSRIGITIGFSINTIVIFFILILCIFDFWKIISQYVAINLSYWFNWLGLIGIWIYTGWGTLTIIYNVNYTPAYKSIKEDYILATGGPYRWVRHPMYTSKALAPIIFFIATGTWFALFGLISWIVLPSQAKAEEKQMQEKFGNIYTIYAEKTGRFFPKLRCFRKKQR